MDGVRWGGKSEEEAAAALHREREGVLWKEKRWEKDTRCMEAAEEEVKEDSGKESEERKA